MTKKISIFIILLFATILSGCQKQTQKNQQSYTDTPISQKQSSFNELVKSKLLAQKFTLSNIDTNNWDIYNNEKYKFSFKYPKHVKVDTIEENLYEEVVRFICIKEIEHHQVDGCDIEFFLYTEESENDIISDLKEYSQFLDQSQNNQYQYLEFSNNVLLYKEGLYQESWFYNTDGKFFMIFSDSHFMNKVSDEEIVKGIIQSLTFR